MEKMTYKLAIKLLEAGWPSNKIWFGVESDGSKFVLGAPNLSDLIHACGKDGIFLWKHEEVWCANEIDASYHCFTQDYIDDKFSPSKGSFPEEAVANLWLTLNKQNLP